MRRVNLGISGIALAIHIHYICSHIPRSWHNLGQAGDTIEDGKIAIEPKKVIILQ
jgi:hypothetical protein